LEKRDKESWLHVVCPPFFIATRQRCGGAYREELGDLWVAFFLAKLQFYEEPIRLTAKQLGKSYPSVSPHLSKARRTLFRLCNQCAASNQLNAIYSMLGSFDRRLWLLRLCHLLPQKRKQLRLDNLLG